MRQSPSFITAYGHTRRESGVRQSYKFVVRNGLKLLVMVWRLFSVNKGLVLRAQSTVGGPGVEN